MFKVYVKRRMKVKKLKGYRLKLHLNMPLRQTEKAKGTKRIEIKDIEETTDGIAQRTIVRRSKTNQNENTKRKMLITDTEMRI